MSHNTAIPNSKLLRWFGAFSGFYRPVAEEVRLLDPVSRFLYAARSVILIISAQAAVIAGLLAMGDREFDWINFVLVLSGLVIAHMISNLSNDYFDYTRGHDTVDSPRLRYTVHPLASGVLEPRTLVTGLVILSLAGLGIAAFFIYQHGGQALAFVSAGVLLLFAYDAAPVPLKKIGLGEIAVFLVWGPLMIGGGYMAITGHVSVHAFLASIPYGIGAMSILVGKHIDQLNFDQGKAIHTLPVLIGESNARWLNFSLIVLMYVVVAGLVLTRHLSPFVCVVLIALPRALHALTTLKQPRPATPPPGYVGWPLWYHRVSLVHNRLFGWLYISGLAVGALFR